MHIESMMIFECFLAFCLPVNSQISFDLLFYYVESAELTVLEAYRSV